MDKDSAVRYSRHFVLKGVGVNGQKKLLSSKVLVIGAGGLGSNALLHLAAAGVGNIGIVDYDDVDLSNLQRQIIHKTATVGTPKVNSARDAIKELNPDVKVDIYNQKLTTDNIIGVISGYDFVLDCVDRFETKFLINDACVMAKIPYCHAGVVKFEGQVMTVVPGSPCLRCLLGGVPPRDEIATCSSDGVLGSVVGVIGSIQATEAVKYLLGIGELLTGKVLTFDGLNMRMGVTKFNKPNPHCAVCGVNPTITNLADNKAEYEVTSCAIK